MTFSVMKGVSGMKRFATVFLAIEPGCAPGKTACCPRSAPNLNMCNCGCYAKTNYNTSKGGCNV
jgi:hypothetical protein